MLRRSLLLAPIALLASCGGGGDIEEDVSFTPQAQAQAAFGEIPAGTYVIRRNEDAVALASSPDFRNRAVPPIPSLLPAIDYSKFMLIGVSYGLRGTCDDAEIVSVRRRGDAVVVEHRKIEAAAHPLPCGVGLTPWTTFATIPLSPHPVEFMQLAPRVLPPPG
jgi:hypothetical protein